MIIFTQRHIYANHVKICLLIEYRGEGIEKKKGKHEAARAKSPPISSVYKQIS